MAIGDVTRGELLDQFGELDELRAALSALRGLSRRHDRFAIEASIAICRRLQTLHDRMSARLAAALAEEG